MSDDWIACSERMPDTYGRYSAAAGWSAWLLALTPGGDQRKAAYSSVLKRWHAYGNEPIAVTHWQPLPSPPTHAAVQATTGSDGDKEGT